MLLCLVIATEEGWRVDIYVYGCIVAWMYLVYDISSLANNFTNYNNNTKFTLQTNFIQNERMHLQAPAPIKTHNTDINAYTQVM